MQTTSSHHRLAFQILFYAILTLGIYLGMRSEQPPTPIKFNGIDSVYHAGGLLLCTLLSYLAHPRLRWWWRGAFMFAVGAAVEYVQSFQPTRTAELGDIYANSVGVVAGLIVLWIWRRQRTRA